MTADPIVDTRLARRRVPLIDGVDKVTGRARYTVDLDHADALVGRILRSPVSHGDIVRLDVSKARALEGVFAVITGDDCPYTYGVLPVAMNEYPMARGRVRYRGEPIAAVAAIDAETAEQALALIELEIEQAAGLLHLGRGARARRHPAARTTSPTISSARCTTNSATGRRASPQADLVREEKISCAEIDHAQIEPHACLAEYDPLTERLRCSRCRR